MLIMVQAHVLDSWTSIDARATTAFGIAMIAAGFAAPLFLFCAGLAVALSASSKLRRHGDAAAASRAVMKRGAWILVLAFLFRIQAWFLGWSHNPASLLKVDILNVMGPSIVAAGALWAAFHGRVARCAAFGVAAAVIAFSAPFFHETAALDFLPDPLENYLRPPRGSGWFSIFPWTGFVFAGAVAGVLLSDVRTPEEESRLNVSLACAGAVLAAAAYAASYLPAMVGRSEFWGSSPSFFFLRAGILTAAVPLAYLWRHAATSAWSPLEQLGRSSLFVYWIHVEMVYGLISLKIHKSLTHPQAWVGFGGMAVLLLGCTLLRDKIEVSLSKSWFYRQAWVNARRRENPAANTM